jgi:hypothetical protein
MKNMFRRTFKYKIKKILVRTLEWTNRRQCEGRRTAALLLQYELKCHQPTTNCPNPTTLVCPRRCLRYKRSALAARAYQNHQRGGRTGKHCIINMFMQIRKLCLKVKCADPGEVEHSSWVHTFNSGMLIFRAHRMLSQSECLHERLQPLRRPQIAHRLGR